MLATLIYYKIEVKKGSKLDGYRGFKSSAPPCHTYLQNNKLINTSCLNDSYIVFTLKLESGSKITIFGLKMMVKSGLEKFILKSLHEGR